MAGRMVAILITAIAVRLIVPPAERFEFPRGLVTPPASVPAAADARCRSAYQRLYRRPELG